jgi:CrcB protein
MAARLFGLNFPWGTLIVNVTGSFLMGALVAALAVRYSVSNELRTFLAIGVLGGFTTFSSFSLDFVFLLERKQVFAALAYMSASVMLSILALFIGLQMMRSLLS